MFGFRLVFYRETKWPNVVLEIDFGSRFRTHLGARRNVWAFENVKTLPKQGPEQELVPAVIFFSENKQIGPKKDLKRERERESERERER